MKRKIEIEYDHNHPFSRAYTRYKCCLEDEMMDYDAFIFAVEKLSAELQTLEALLFKAQPDIREITFHSDGRVIAKTGANAPKPKKLYSARQPKDTFENFGTLAKIAVKKLIEDNK